MIVDHKSECPGGAGHYAENQNVNDFDYPCGQRPRKAVLTQIAELALAGHAVHELRSGDFLVCKYGLSYYAQDFVALQAFAKRLGVCNG
jgi:hypothetical protein